MRRVKKICTWRRLINVDGKVRTDINVDMQRNHLKLIGPAIATDPNFFLSYYA
jgi:hypothetical protein